MDQKPDQKEAEKLGRFLHSLHNASAPLLLLDYDGTLADFRIDRFTARPWSGVREILNQIQRDRRTQLRVITGRPASEINALLQLDSPVEVWGLHGAERLHLDGRREMEQASAEAMEKLDDVKDQLRRDAFGGLFEDKPNAAVMHWRGLYQHRAKTVEQKTRALFEQAALASDLSLLPFESGVELRIGRDKGGAVQAIVEQAEPGSPVVYLGDDFTDESAFRAVNGVEGPHLSVLVRRARRETAADVWLRPPEELRWFLNQWEVALRGLPVRWTGSGYYAHEAAEMRFGPDAGSIAHEDAC